MRYINKQFLSDDYDESGSVVLKCESPKKQDEQSPIDRIIHPEDAWVDAGMQVRDCYGKPVDLCFSFQNEKGLTKRLAKVDNLITMLEEFKVKLTECWEDVDKDTKEEVKDEAS